MQLSKRYKIQTNINKVPRGPQHPAAIPARIALWFGLIAVAIGYVRHIGPLMVIGFIVMAVGVGLWWVFRAANQIRTWRVEYTDRRINKRLGISLSSTKNIEQADRESNKLEPPIN